MDNELKALAVRVGVQYKLTTDKQINDPKEGLLVMMKQAVSEIPYAVIMEALPEIKAAKTDTSSGAEVYE
jgi:hypothetical protein